MTVRRLLFALLLFCTNASAAKVLVLRDGKQMRVAAYRLEGRLVIFTTIEGHVRSVESSFVDLEATRQTNHVGVTSAAKTHRQASGPEAARNDDALRQRLPTRRANQPWPSRGPTSADSLAPHASRSLPHLTRARKLASSCGATLLFGQIPSLVDSEILRLETSRADKTSFDVVKKAFAETFATETDDRVLPPPVASVLGDGEARDLTWLASPLCQRMQRLELYATSVDGRALLELYADGLSRHMPSATRLKILQRIDRALGLSTVQVEQRLRVLRALIEARNHLVPVEARLESDRIEQAIQAARSQLKLSAGNRSLVVLLFTYRTLGESDLEAYVRHWESRAGQRLSRLLQRAASLAVEQASARAVERVKREAVGMDMGGDSGERAASTASDRQLLN